MSVAGHDVDLDQTIDVGAIVLMRGLPNDCRSRRDLISWPKARGMRMSDTPINVIEAAIRSAFTSYPKEDDTDAQDLSFDRKPSIKF